MISVSRYEFTELALGFDKTHPEWTALPRSLGRTALSPQPLDEANEEIISQLIDQPPIPLYLVLHEAMLAENENMVDLVANVAHIAIENAEVAAQGARNAAFAQHHFTSAEHYSHVYAIATEAYQFSPVLPQNS